MFSATEAGTANFNTATPALRLGQGTTMDDPLGLLQGPPLELAPPMQGMMLPLTKALPPRPLITIDQ